MGENQQAMLEAVAGIRREMDTWKDVQVAILDVLNGHGSLLEAILDAVQREPAEDGDPLGDLLRKVVATGEAQVAGLRRVEAQLAAIRK